MAKKKKSQREAGQFLQIFEEQEKELKKFLDGADLEDLVDLSGMEIDEDFSLPDEEELPNDISRMYDFVKSRDEG